VSLSAGAFAGAFAAFFFVALLSNGTRGGADRTILAGVAASQLFNAATSYVVTTSGNAQQARDVMFWLLGSFGGVRWPDPLDMLNCRRSQGGRGEPAPAG